VRSCKLRLAASSRRSDKVTWHALTHWHCQCDSFIQRTLTVVVSLRPGATLRRRAGWKQRLFAVTAVRHAFVCFNWNICVTLCAISVRNVLTYFADLIRVRMGSTCSMHTAVLSTQCVRTWEREARYWNVSPRNRPLPYYSVSKQSCHWLPKQWGRHACLTFRCFASLWPARLALILAPAVCGCTPHFPTSVHSGRRFQ
jgi:hypothetical protein